LLLVVVVVALVPTEDARAITTPTAAVAVGQEELS
jgi:hypothetical protein